jgi:hypothetical protein
MQRDELGAPAAARASEADQGSISDVARVVASHRLDESPQSVDEHGIRRRQSGPRETSGDIAYPATAVWAVLWAIVVASSSTQLRNMHDKNT